jgi:hypothetical protein
VLRQLLTLSHHSFRYALRTFGLPVLFLNLLWCAWALHAFHTAEAWLQFGERHILLSMALLVIVGLSWGKVQRDSKCLMMSEMAPQLRCLSFSGEALGLALFAMLFFLIGWGVLSWTAFQADWPELRQRGKILKMTQEDEVWRVEASPSGHALVSLYFLEGQQISPVTYSSWTFKSDGQDREDVFRSMRDQMLRDVGVLEIPRRLMPPSGHELTLVLREARALDFQGSYLLTLRDWGIQALFILLSLSFILVLLGKHISLELGLVVLLSWWLVKISFSLFSEDEFDRIMRRLANEGVANTRFQVLWWQEMLEIWSVSLKDFFSELFFHRQSVRERLLNGEAWSLNGSWSLSSLKLIGVMFFSLILDRFFAKFRDF